MFCCSKRGLRQQTDADQLEAHVLSERSAAVVGQASVSTPGARAGDTAIRAVSCEPVGGPSLAAAEESEIAGSTEAPAVTPPVQEEESFCRVCWGPETAEEPLVRPCACKGSLTFIHKECLQQWIVRSQRTKCEVSSADDCPALDWQNHSWLFLQIEGLQIQVICGIGRYVGRDSSQGGRLSQS